MRRTFGDALLKAHKLTRIHALTRMAFSPTHGFNQPQHKGPNGTRLFRGERVPNEPLLPSQGWAPRSAGRLPSATNLVRADRPTMYSPEEGVAVQVSHKRSEEGHSAGRREEPQTPISLTQQRRRR